MPHGREPLKWPLFTSDESCDPHPEFPAPLSLLPLPKQAPFFCTWCLLIPWLLPTCLIASRCTLGGPWPPPQGPSHTHSRHVTWGTLLGLYPPDPAQDPASVLGIGSPVLHSSGAHPNPLGDVFSLCPARAGLGRKHPQCLSSPTRKTGQPETEL